MSRLHTLLMKYPNRSKSEFINAALEFYLPYAERGVDGNLLPYTLESGPKLPDAPVSVEQIKTALRALIAEAGSPS